jgi:tight adherence protein B
MQKFNAQTIIDRPKRLAQKALLLIFPLRRLRDKTETAQNVSQVSALKERIALINMKLKLGQNVLDITPNAPDDELQFLFDYSQNLGTPLMQVLEVVEGVLEDVDELEVAKTTALAMPKATVKLLRFLPLAGIMLGYILGANPLTTLLTSPAGLIFLVLGLLFMLGGNKWTTSIVRDFEKNEAFNFATDPRILLALIKVAVQKGASITRAFEALNVPEVANLERGVPYRYANLPQYLLCLEDAYNLGGSPVALINVEIEKRNIQMKKTYKNCAEKLAVELVIPLGICYLPSFICIGVVPIIISFLG